MRFSILWDCRLNSTTVFFSLTVELKTVGEFKRNKTDANQILELIPGINITWSEDGRRTSPPADRPVCGFMGELCPTPSPSEW